MALQRLDKKLLYETIVTECYCHKSGFTEEVKWSVEIMII